MPRDPVRGFHDEIVLTLEGGRGGDGCVAFMREKYMPRGGPAGGDGGKGGDVILEPRHDVHGFFGLRGRRTLRAKSGMQGGNNKRHGRGADDLIVHVPVGTEVRDADSDVLLKDLDEEGVTVRIVRGGDGGRGNARFAHATRQAPRKAETGRSGEVRRVRLVLKLLADVGLVGLPNAGKSTLLARLTHSRTQAGAHRFTTLAPHLGVVDLGPDRQLTLADLPGLIEGAHSGRGLGDRFLKHVERTQVLLHLVAWDPTGVSPPVDEAYRTVRDELRLYDPRLADKPEIVVLTKCDGPGFEEALNSLASESDSEVAPISSVTGHGLDALMARVVGQLDAESDLGPLP